MSRNESETAQAPAPEILEVTAPDGATLKIEMHGDSPHRTIVCWPGAGQDATTLSRLGAFLTHCGWSSAIVNMRGTGGSSPPRGDESMADLVEDVRAVVRCLDKGQVVMLGAAFGNRVARAASKHHPQLFRGVILLCAGGEVPPQSAAGTAFLERVRADTRPAVRMCTRIAQSTAHSYFGDGGDQPMLILQGTEDQIAPWENGLRIATRRPSGVTLVPIAQAGHALLSQQPAAVCNAVADWLSATFAPQSTAIQPR